MEHTTEECVYILHAEGTPYYKIGTSRKVYSRPPDLQTGCPLKLILRKVVVGGKSIERRLHEYFSDFRVRGEWFKLPLMWTSQLLGLKAVVIAELGSSFEEFLYIVKVEDQSRYRFGHAISPEQRMQCLISSGSEPILPVGIWQGGIPLERIIDGELRSYHDRQGWFVLPERVAATLISDLNEGRLPTSRSLYVPVPVPEGELRDLLLDGMRGGQAKLAP